MDKLINILVSITLIEMMTAIGLGVMLADLVAVVRDWRLLARAAIANYAIVPAITVGLLIWFRAEPMVAAGFLILAVCPGAPYGPPFAAIAKANVAVSIGMMAILAGSSAVLAPLLLGYLLPLVSAAEPLQVDAAKIAGTLLITQLLPLCLGVTVRHWRPLVAARVEKPAIMLSKILNLVVVGLILIAQFQLLAAIRLHGLFGMLALLIASWGAGWLLGGPELDTRKAMTLTTALRNVGVGLVIASGPFAGTPAVTATLAYGLFAIVGSLCLALVWAKRGATTTSDREPLSPSPVEPVATQT